MSATLLAPAVVLTATAAAATNATTATVFATTADPLAGSVAIAGFVLATVLVVAAVLKLRSPATTVDEFASLEVPLPPIAARAVPIGELLVAAILLTRPALGGPLALLVLTVFTAVLIRVLRSGRTVSCGCLGALDRGPVSTTTVVRNGLFLTLAAVVAIGSRIAEPTGSIVVVPTATLAVQIVVVAGSVAVIGATIAQLIVLRRRIGRIWSVALTGEIDRVAATDDPGADNAIDNTNADNAINDTNNDRPAIDGPMSGSNLEVLPS